MNTPGPGQYELETVFERYSRNHLAKSTQGTGAKILALSKEKLAVPGVGQYNDLNSTLYSLPKKTCIIGSSRRKDLSCGVTSPGP